MNERKLLEILKEKDEQLNKWYLSYNEVLNENEKLKQELGDLKLAYTVSVDKAIMIEQELQEQIKKMKCCENCKHYIDSSCEFESPIRCMYWYTRSNNTTDE